MADKVLDLQSIRATLAASGVDTKLVDKVVAQIEADGKNKVALAMREKCMAIDVEYNDLVIGFINGKAFQAVLGKYVEAGVSGGKWGVGGVLGAQDGPTITIPGLPTTKAKTGGSSGKSKEEFGMALDEIAKAFGTTGELAKVAAAEAMPTGSARSNATFSAKDAIKRRAIKEGLLVAQA